MPRFELYDLVKLKRPNDQLVHGAVYKITNIDRGIDGAYDWDDLSLESVHGKFTEFDFELDSTAG